MQVPQSVCGVLLQQLIAALAVYISLGLLVVSCFIVTTGRVEGVVINCKPPERAALLDLKKAAEDWQFPGSVSRVLALSHEQKERWAWFQWDEEEEECCNWQGVVCDATSGRISQLRLPSPCAAYHPHSEFEFAPLQCTREIVCGQLPASLSRLESLEVLDVRGGCFSSVSAPRAFSSFTNLSHLDLSGNAFLSDLLLPPRLIYLNLSNAFGISLSLSKLMAGSVPNLEYLDLAGSMLYIEGGGIPEKIGSLHNLKYLDLSNNALRGVIPQQIGSLQNLVYLDLQGNYFQNPVPWPSLANLSHLSHLGLGSIIPLEWPEASDHDGQCNWKALESLSASNIRFASNHTKSLPFCLHDPALVTQLHHLSFEIVGYVPDVAGLSIAPLLHSLSAANASLSLETLSLPSTSLWEFETVHSKPAWLQALHTPLLQVLDLSQNQLSGIPFWLPHLPLLHSLDMSSNNLSTFPPQLIFFNNSISGAVPTFLLKPSLLHLDVSDNLLSGNFPFSLENLSSLSYLDLSGNSLTGKIPHSVGNLSSLVYLDLSSNSLTGNIPLSIGNLSSLETLWLSGNSLTGTIPAGIFQDSLAYLDLSQNQLVGNLPKLQRCFSLSLLDMSSNLLGGALELNAFQNCPILTELDLSNNRFSSLSSSLNFHSQLTSLDISNNQLGGEIPKEMGTYCPNLGILDLSNNSLSGALPVEIGNISGLFQLDISNNLLSSDIPASLGKLSGLGVLALYNNKLSGSLPPALQNCSSLEILDVGYNQLSGSIPEWLNGQTFPYLQVLILSSNQFQSSTPILGSLVQNFTGLQILGLASNLLRGLIPSNLNRLQAMTTQAQHAITHNANVQVTIKRVPEIFTSSNLEFLTALDLSDNLLEGGIPPEIGALQGLFSLNLSHNLLNGSIPSSLRKLAGVLESLDLSNNQLTGSIPSELCDFNSLGALDLSHNHLQGTIPASSTCTHLCTFDESYFANNDRLLNECGAVLDDQDTHKPLPPLADASPILHDHTSLMDKLQEYISIAGWGIGHIVGFVLMALFLCYRARTD